MFPSVSRTDAFVFVQQYPHPSTMDSNTAASHSGGMMQPTETALWETDAHFDHAASSSSSSSSPTRSNQRTDLGEVVEELEGKRSVTTQTQRLSFLPPLRKLRKPQAASKETSEPRRRITADPFDPNPRKRPRNHYTQMQKDLVIQAGESSSADARRIGALFGMPPATVKTVLYHARRKEQGLEEGHATPASSSTAPRSQRGRKAGTPRRLFPEDEEVMRELLHDDCTMTADQLADHMNLEKLRRIMIRLEEQLPAEQRLRDEEKVFLGPLNRETCLENPVVKELYDKTHIEGTRSVYRALKRNIFTLKRVIPAAGTTMNSEASMQKRLAFAKELRDLLLEDNAYIVYIDEMPFYLPCGRHHGLPPRRDGAVHEDVPVMSCSTQVAMAVSHMHGLLYGKLYPPEMHSTGSDGQRKTKKALKATYTQVHFKDFLNNLLHTLWHKRESLGLSGANIVFLMASAPEQGQRAAEAATQMLQAYDSFHLWREWIATGRCSLSVKFSSPESPSLNLTEVYNRALRQRANQLRKTPDFIGKLESKDIPRGQVQKTRVKVLCDIIERAMADLQRRALKQASKARMAEEALHVIQLNGFLDKHWRPVQLRHNQAHSTDMGDNTDADNVNDAAAADNDEGGSGSGSDDDDDDDDDDDE
ncbi:hypothetical protein PTSG_05005 [Salpingoeca rosetta]|uniref:Uncharacterized protein n=1 Tax=Salpingoeca rosetta (strain ATCC 50818 / BSB-021) TaxID=946362 RepID=F2U986_SALR5|nr:uncharacterized protein PTSG_05005 [Salpingoeca rosetta]EGD73289.1 hypothetical protein PTSG_05005 [Salpingoeca rosetta]|eukprot:XP_004994320.1 hypothetical protein PTSG_05005 [Salpingoeca rosetta]